MAVLTRRRSIGIILSGSPYLVCDDDAPHVDPDGITFGVPVLGICYGFRVSQPSTATLATAQAGRLTHYGGYPAPATMMATPA